jgi:hypothetical protein
MEDYARTAIPEEGFKGNFFVLFLLFSFLDVLAQSICFFTLAGTELLRS